MDIITSKMKLDSIYKDLASSIAKEFEMDEDALELIRKTVAVDSRSYFNEDEKSSVDYLTTKYADHDAEIVVPKNINLKIYQKTPVVLWCHKYYDDLPLGKALWIKPDEKGLVGKTKYHTRPGSMGLKVYEYLSDGFPLATSIGFVGIKATDSDDFGKLDLKELGLDKKEVAKARRIYTESLLLEFSRVPVASNFESVNIAVSKGLLLPNDETHRKYFDFGAINKETPDEIETKSEEQAGAGGDWEQVIEKSQEEEIQGEVKTAGGLIIPEIGEGESATGFTGSLGKEVIEPDPSSYQDKDGNSERVFDFTIVEEKEIVTKPETTENYHRIPVSEGHGEHKIRTIVISSEKGIKALYCTDCKSVVTFLLPTSSYSMEEAQAWVDNHSKSMEGDVDSASDSDVDLHTDKTVSDTKVASCTCPDCGETYPATEDGTCAPCPECNEKPEDTEEDACKPKKPKKSLDEIIEENLSNQEFSSEAFPVVKKEIRWNQSVSKLFDIASVPSKPANYTMAIYCQFLECKTKNIYQNDFFIWAPLMGSYLAGFKACSKNFKLKDTRCFSRYEQLEYPPSYEVIQINSKTQDDFLVQGSAFYDFEGEPIILQFTPDRFGLNASIFTSRKNMSLSKEFIESVHAWVEKENPLKDEKMGLNGEFLEVDSRDDWNTIVLSESNLKASQYAAKLINEKGLDFNGRGMLLVGVPGTGKTKVARILMTQTKHTFIWVSSKDLTNTYYPEQKIALGFKLARQLAPCVLCLEDIDNWIDGKIVDMMKTELDGVKKNKGVITILTTNNPEKLPSALLDRPGRFHDVLNFDVPTKELRREMITRWSGDLDAESLKSVVDSTEGFSGAYMWELIEFAKDIAESNETDMAEALLMSLAKLNEQKELIQSIQKPKAKSIDEKITPIGIDDITLKKFEDYASDILKSGRRLSSTSINSLREALKLIEELIASSEPKQEEEKSFQIESTPEPEFDLETTIKSSLEDIFTKKLKYISTEDIVSEAIKRAKGEIF